MKGRKMGSLRDHDEDENECGSDDRGRVRIVIDKVKYRVPSREMTGREIRALAEPDICADRDLWNDVVDALDEIVEDDDVIQLKKGMRFFSVPREINPGQVTLAPGVDVSSLQGVGSDVTVIDHGSMSHVVVDGFPLPTGFSLPTVGLLLRLPRGFPDAAPDMFWVSPALTLAHRAVVPGTQSIETHDGRQWQRWSRHIGGQWRAGIDDLDTYVGFVRSCLRTAVRRAA